MAEVIVLAPVGLLTYRVPAAIKETLAPGSPVRVPLGARKASGWVVALSSEPPPQGVTLRDIESVDSERPPLSAALLQLVRFAGDYYSAPYGDVLATALPPLARSAASRYRLGPEGEEALRNGKLRKSERELLELAQGFSRGFGVAAIERKLSITRSSAAARIKRARQVGWLLELSGRRGRRTSVVVERTANGCTPPRKANAAWSLLEHIPQDGTVSLVELCQKDRQARKKLKTLIEAGAVRKLQEPAPLAAVTPSVPSTPPPVPTAEQANAISAIGTAVAARTYQAFLLQGVTGSGKTEIYLRIIEQCLAQGRTALVLVPEIALTPQLAERFHARFGATVATFHSGLTAAERRDEWERVHKGEAQIGLGARSALFLPLENLGVVVVDEEHETSFKQEEAPRYNARDLAVVRAQQAGAVVVLGSATPSLESHANTQSGRYQPLFLHARVRERPLPEVERLSLSEEERAGDSILTVRLARALERTLDRGEQAILFLNRRGFAPYVQCRDCGHSHRCPSCDVSLTLHRRRGVLLCHYCGFEEYPPDRCVACDGHRVDAFGLGVERLEAEIVELFGKVPIARLDRDTVRRRADLERELSRFRSGETPIMVGTQMVVKGHDFPNVTLVGVALADASLNFPDFRAAERTFQLLTQVAGRAGRGDRPGRVLVQSFNIEHYAIKCAADHDYARFVDLELAARRELAYPPFSHLVLLRFESEQEELAAKSAAEAALALSERVAAAKLPVAVLGPAPAPLARLKGLWRTQLLLKSPSRRAVRSSLEALPRKRSAEVRRVLDVDPYSML